MKKYFVALLTAAAMIGCQGSGSRYHMQSAPVVSSTKAPEKSMIQQVDYNDGRGAFQNNVFSQKVAQAVPSTGMGHPGGCSCSHCQQMAGGPGMGMPGQVPLGPSFTSGRTQVLFLNPAGMKIGWESAELGGFTPPQLQAPSRYNFLQRRIYRLKLSDIPNRPGLEMYPTLEVFPGNAQVDAFLAHNAVPIEMSDEDLDQALSGNFVTKVVYLPDAKHQELAIPGVETLVSTRLDPGVDPVKEAERKGSILVVIRMGSVDLEMPHSPELFETAAPPAVPNMLEISEMMNSNVQGQ